MVGKGKGETGQDTAREMGEERSRKSEERQGEGVRRDRLRDTRHGT
jgi:hypothetical protein